MPSKEWKDAAKACCLSHDGYTFDDALMNCADKDKKLVNNDALMGKDTAAGAGAQLQVAISIETQF